MGIIDYFKISGPSEKKVPAAAVQKTYKKFAMQSFLAGTLGYSLYYVCRTTLNVVKQPIMDSGLMDATQIGVVSSCLLFAYAAGKFVNGFLTDYSNIKRFMAVGLFSSALMNLIMGFLGASEAIGATSNILFFICFCIMWAVSGWSQSIGSPCAVVALSRWFPLKTRGTFYGFFSASHNLGEWFSFLFVGIIVRSFSWQWGFIGAAIAGFIGVALIIFWMHDTPEGCGLPPIEELTGEKKEEKKEETKDVKAIQKQVLRNPGVWILALSSAFMYMSRYAINGCALPPESQGLRPRRRNLHHFHQCHSRRHRNNLLRMDF